MDVAISVYKESLPQLTACFTRIHANLKARVMIFLDGPRDDVDDLAKRLDFEITHGEHLAGIAVPLFWKRIVDWFSADICLKLDPDTMVDRPPVFFPDADYFGLIESVHSYGIPYVQGGVTGLSKKAVGLIRSGLDNPIYNSTKTYEEIDNPPLCDDKMIGHILNAAGIEPVNWSECYSRWKVPVGNEDLKYAIVHPRYY